MIYCRDMQNYKLREEVSKEVADELQGHSTLVQKLLFGRGIKTKLEAQNFLNPSYENLHDPYLLEDMEIAVKRINISPNCQSFCKI